ncbi:O-methylsterigmatocystin oxidoreductase [Rhizoctonia solani]|uniref:O-methylsterigmatocystin oxidoreductase n=1 Tax=Rhizoctonia solani TaxID=456999 RepID=A0A0K6FUM5_9AGAM|nr:O-methylsterigmatocystin oxidoreductase [Rhizoctonia solani]
MSDARLVTYAALTLSALGLIWHASRRKVVNPPSPVSWPFIGNLLSMTPGPEYLTYKRISEDLKSDIIFLELLGNKIIVLNSMKAASELLEQRSALYSDRICPPVLKDPGLFDWSGSTGMLGYNDVWRHHRRMISKFLGSRESAQFYRIQERQARSLLRNLMDIAPQADPFEEVKEAFLVSMASTMFELIYGYRLHSKHDSFFQGFQKILEHGMDAVMLTNFYVNLFPALARVPDWVPGTGWKRTIRGWRDHKAQAAIAPLEWVKTQVSAGVAQPSLLGSLLEEDVPSGLTLEERDHRLKEMGLALYAGESSAGILMSFVAAMVSNPEAQAKAQQELDTVLGPRSSPTILDRERLPYVNNLISEVIRWRPALPTALPHVCLEDDKYQGYDITKGTIVFGNVWSMSRDEAIYSSPEDFDPERFSDGKLPQIPVFGWGRRRCSGASFGETSVFITVASLLATFTFSRAKKQSEDVKLENTSNALFLELKSFEFEFNIRSKAHGELVHKHFEVDQ